jgi:hypothetical protein
MASPAPDEITPLFVGVDRVRRDLLNKDSLGTIGFDPDGDPDNPLDWPPPLKWKIVALLALTSFMV